MTIPSIIYRPRYSSVHYSVPASLLVLPRASSDEDLFPAGPLVGPTSTSGNFPIARL